jgi:hypothetical protein
MDSGKSGKVINFFQNQWDDRTLVKKASRLSRHTGGRLEITVWHLGEGAEF